MEFIDLVGVTQVARKKLERIFWPADVLHDGRSDNFPFRLVDGDALLLLHRLQSDECAQRAGSDRSDHQEHQGDQPEAGGDPLVHDGARRPTASST
jgi:hypothetical protein